MTNFRRQLLMVAYKLSDVLIMIGSFFVTSIIVSNIEDIIHLNDFFQMRIKVTNFVLFLILLLLWHIIFLTLGHYHSKRLSNLKTEIKDIIKATSIGTFAIYILSLLFNIWMVNSVFVVVFWTISTATTILTRYLLRYTLKLMRRRGRNLRHLLVVGTNYRTLQFIRKIESEQELGYVITGFVDTPWKGSDEFQKAGYSLVSDFNGFAEFINNNVVDEVLISLPIKSHYKETSQLVNICDIQGILVRHLSNVSNSRNSNFKETPFENESFVFHHPGSVEGWQVLVKRMLDIILSSLFLAMFIPLFLLTAIIIKVTSPGPVFFIQERVGLNRRRFRLYKFRTMAKGAEQKQVELEDFNEVDGAAFKIKNDPRITQIGKILRKTSIDELPQMFNVLKGEMSLVGPRPLPVRDYNYFNTDWHRRRFSVRPGITCLWQVKGRHNITFAKWMELDLEYIDQWSLLLDLSILIRTIPVVLKGFGAS